MKRSLYIIGLLSLLNARDFKNETVVDGYVRGTYQSHDVVGDRVYRDDAIGGKLHFETASTDGVSLGASLYTTTSVFNDDNEGLVPLRGENHKSYAILGELYLNAKFGKSELKVGRQELETPFAQMDDVGMIPNTFEAVMFYNHGIKDTTIILGHIRKMAGVDAKVVDKFTQVNGSKGMQVLGVIYQGIDKFALSGWYYKLKNAKVDKISYFEALYEEDFGNYAFDMGLQYARENYRVGEEGTVYGATITGAFKPLGLTVTTAYTHSSNNGANSGFGGGPFFSNSEYLIVDNVGKDGSAKWLGAEFDGSVLGYKELTLGIGKITLETQEKKKSTELDIVASYEFSRAMEMHLVYSDLKGTNVGEDDAKHLRVYANYKF